MGDIATLKKPNLGQPPYPRAIFNGINHGVEERNVEAKRNSLPGSIPVGSLLLIRGVFFDPRYSSASLLCALVVRGKSVANLVASRTKVCSSCNAKKQPKHPCRELYLAVCLTGTEPNQKIRRHLGTEPVTDQKKNNGNRFGKRFNDF